MKKATGRTSDQFNLRLPDGMRERIAEEAEKSGRSMNAEIVHRLANSLGNPSFSDFALGLGEELDFELMLSASQNNRSLQEEMIERLKNSLRPADALLSDLENKAWSYRNKYEELLSIVMQLTPEERRLLEERAEIMDYARKNKIRSKKIGDFVRLNPIGKRGRVILTAPKSDYTPIFGEKTETKTPDRGLREKPDTPKKD